MEAREQLIPEPRLCTDPLANGWSIDKKHMQEYEKKREPHGVNMAVAFTAIAFMGLSTLWAGLNSQPVPCEQQANKPAAVEPPLAIVIDKTDLATAKSNRELIEQALRGGTAQLPAGLVAVDRGIRLPSGGTLAGVGSKTILRNVSTGAPFGDNCTVQVIQSANAGFGYSGGDVPAGIKVNGNVVTFTTADAVKQFAPGSYCYTFVWDGYTKAGAKTRRHRITSRTGATVTLDSPPDPTANAAIWTARALPLAGAAEGSAKLAVSPVAVNQWVLITAGPQAGNECSGEFRQVVASDASTITLDRPLRSSYGATALVILVAPTVGPTVRDLAIEPLTPNYHPIACKNCTGITLVNLDVAGDLHLFGCQYAAIANCRLAGTLNLNNCRDVQIDDCRCREVFIEEMCADLDFARLVVAQSRQGGAGFNQPVLSPCERIRIRDSIITGAADLPLHLRGRENVVDGVTLIGSRAAASWVMADLSGDRLKVRDLRTDLTIKISGGVGGDVARVRGTLYLTGGSGTVAECTRVVPASAAVATAWGVAATQ